MTFNYGQRHSQELDYARKTTKKLGIEHKVIDITTINELLQGSALTSKIDVPEGHYTSENQKITIVPNRNAILLTLATGYAVSVEADVVFYGAHNSDRAIYPDCRKEFVEAFDEMEKIATDNINLKIEAPFIDMAKSDIVKLGLQLKVPFEDTWSCYKGFEKPCGKCGTCVERHEAFELNNAKDPLECE